MSTESIGSDMFPLLEIGLELKKFNYDFIPVSPISHQKKLQEFQLCGKDEARDLQDLFGWGLPLSTTSPLTLEWLHLQTLISMKKARVLDSPNWGRLNKSASCLKKCSIGYSTFEEGRANNKERDSSSHVYSPSSSSLIILHSAPSSTSQDSVPFDSDGSSFLNFISGVLTKYFPDSLKVNQGPNSKASIGRVADVSCGTGAGGIFISKKAEVRELFFIDPNVKAIKFAQVNAKLQDLEKEKLTFVKCSSFKGLRGTFDLIVSNPPHNSSSGTVTKIVSESLIKLAPGGILAMHIRVTIQKDKDLFWNAIKEELQKYHETISVTYTEVESEEKRILNEEGKEERTVLMALLVERKEVQIEPLESNISGTL